MFRFGKRSFLSARPRSFPGLVSIRWFFDKCIEIHRTCTTQQILTYGSGFWRKSWISISDQMTYFYRRILKPSISNVLSPILRKQGLFKKADEWEPQSWSDLFVVRILNWKCFVIINAAFWIDSNKNGQLLVLVEASNFFGRAFTLGDAQQLS